MHRLSLTRASCAALLTVVGLLALPGCSEEEDPKPSGPGTKVDAGTDAGTEPDAGTDAGVIVDAGTPWDGGVTGTFSCAGKQGQTYSFTPGQEQQIQDRVNSLTECATIQLAAGTYTFDNAITIRKDGITFAGAGKGTKGEATGGASSTVLVFTNAAANTNGLDVVGKLFTVRDVAIWNAKKDALRIENSTDVLIQRVRTEWAQQNKESNGKYGIYPVKSKYVTIDDCEAYNAADAGIYVGQTEYAIVRNNKALQNVAGIEIENTRFAFVHGNLAQDNTTGLVVFDLPGNPIVGTDIRFQNNKVLDNNRPNFASVTASSSTVSQVPAGTGTFILASRRVEFSGNTWSNNNTVDIAVLSGLAIEPDPAQWSAGGGNWGTSDIYIHDNTFQGGSGDSVDNGAPDQEKRPFGAVVFAAYQYAAAAQGILRVEHILWDGIDPAPRDPKHPNAINLCVGANTVPQSTKNIMVDFDLQAVSGNLTGSSPNLTTAWGFTKHYAQGAAPYNCAGFNPPVVTGSL
ncbi:hypothetical protein DRW03_28095 [Corallococcus sp. H22C18031201]|uniref:parallel beta-helix domain-containing protein n=1 Tax=Citreicoccus inhibens TaxID=2849499 RepID=UPI000E731840|nr:parallel beta-helix domain-containing protein [Citreicoccus inhibens]MBU8896262.1 right-handed parallel beta-helix repeat-containing protein [Citreicoccus inhibens]RJS17403.1 hypothetical protein DRW03_28095 [Corallococcus sp. H22C18031201]